MNKPAKKTIILFFAFFSVLLLTGCRSVGKTNLPSFIEKFNNSYGEEKINEKDMLIKDNTYYFFLPAGRVLDGEILLTLSENDDGEIYECGISVIKDVEIKNDEFKDIFIAAFCSVTKENKEKAVEVLNSVLDSKEESNKSQKSDNKKSDNKNKNIIKEVNNYKVDFIDNEAGSGVYIYKDSE